MSDIYLSITETPAVVTLSQPVVSGVLSSNVTVSNVVSVSVVTMPAITVQSSAPSVTTVAGSVTVANFPATQVVSVSNLPAVTTVTGTVALDSASLAALENVTVTVGAAVSVSNFPATQTISGTVTANLGQVVGFNAGPNANYGVLLGFNTNYNEFNLVGSSYGLPIKIQEIGIENASIAVTTAGVPVIGTVTVGNSVTIGSLPAISGTVTANAILQNATAMAQAFIDESDAYGAVGVSIVNSAGNISVVGTVTVGNSVTIGAMPNGTLTTRFGTPTTANVSFATTAVTNSSRKYLLIQNVTTGSNVITVGIGFTPTTTQGIQLTAGAGITFESSYIPTGAVQILSSVTASNFTILEA